MTRIIIASTPGGQAWFLGSSIPTGAQTVAFTCTAGAAKRAVIVSLTATGDTGVEDSDQFTNAASAAPSITLSRRWRPGSGGACTRATTTPPP